MELTVFPRVGRVTASEAARYLMKESTEIDFLRLVGGANESGEAGESSSGLFVVGVAFKSEKIDESAVMKVS